MKNPCTLTADQSRRLHSSLSDLGGAMGGEMFTTGNLDAENLTLEKVQKTLDDWKAKDPRGFAEMRLIAAVAKLSVDQLDMISGCAEAGMFDFQLTPGEPKIVREVFLAKEK